MTELPITIMLWATAVLVTVIVAVILVVAAMAGTGAALGVMDTTRKRTGKRKLR